MAAAPLSVSMVRTYIRKGGHGGDRSKASLPMELDDRERERQWGRKRAARESQTDDRDFAERERQIRDSGRKSARQERESTRARRAQRALRG